MTDYDPYIWSISKENTNKEYVPNIKRAGLLNKNREFADFSELWNPIQEKIPETFLRTIAVINFARAEDPGGQIFARKLYGAPIIGKHEETSFVDEKTQMRQSLIYMNVDKSVKITKEEFRAVLVHEIGHAVFRNLKEDELERWSAIDTVEKTSVSEYVSDRRKSGKQQDTVKDDFCESFALFVEIPGLLKIIAPQRYAYMEKLFSNHDEPLLIAKKRENREREVEKYQTEMRNLGWDEEKIRAGYQDGKRYPLNWIPQYIQKYTNTTNTPEREQTE
ncbi:MAG: hypothetical protein N2558_03610 [Patescibacteria group bacterium]|nr:hypothetical protein [Patescibacteria group bacterium]